jgi:multimeric flavodoxin WrbA
MRKGNTYAITKGIVNFLLTKPDVECTEISVADLELSFCRSCHVCFSKGEEHCPHHTAMRGVQSALMECDGVILSGTTYMWALNAAMKNLLDHLAYGVHRPALFGKKGMVIATSAGNGEKAVAKYLKTALGQWGINGAIVITQNTKERQLQSSDKTAVKFDRAAERFYQLIASNRFIAPKLKSIAVHNAFRAMSLSDFAENECDIQFWQQQGFYDRAYPVKAGPKYVAGALMYEAVKHLTIMLGRTYAKHLNTQK